MTQIKRAAAIRYIEVVQRSINNDVENEKEMFCFCVQKQTMSGAVANRIRRARLFNGSLSSSRDVNPY